MNSISLDFAEELKQYSEDKALECFNCGTCAAICPLVHDNFPRRMIRYVQVGAREKVLKIQKSFGVAFTAACVPIRARGGLTQVKLFLV